MLAARGRRIRANLFAAAGWTVGQSRPVQVSKIALCSRRVLSEEERLVAHLQKVSRRDQKIDVEPYFASQRGAERFDLASFFQAGEELRPADRDDGREQRDQPSREALPVVEQFEKRRVAPRRLG